MVNKFFIPPIFLFFIVIGCTKTDGGKAASGVITSGTAYSSAPGSGSGDSSNQNESGLVTAGEWNDGANWSFWKTVTAKDEYDTILPSWNFYTDNRISVSVTGSDNFPLADALVKLKQNGVVIFTAHTDNSCNAELWINLFQSGQAVDFTIPRRFNNLTQR